MPSHPRREHDGIGRQCDHCGYPIPQDPHQSDDAAVTFCSLSCLEASEDGGSIPDPAGYKRVVTGVEPLDALLLDGLPTDSFVLLSGDEGARREELLTELVWRALKRNEPAVALTYANPPTAILERFFESGWNVIPALENDRLRIIDAFTHRLEDRDSFLDTRTEWTAFLGEVASDAIVEIRDPSDVREVANSLTRTLGAMEMSKTGLVTIDSIDEIETLIQEQLIHNFLKDIRATVCKARYVPIVAGGTTAGDEGAAVADEYLFDGIVDLRMTGHVASDTRFTQLGVRKLTTARVRTEWITTGYAKHRGLFAVDPPAETHSLADHRTGAQRMDSPD
ncbi:RAD55 family ATPase [Halostagnicola bangensis]